MLELVSLRPFLPVAMLVGSNIFMTLAWYGHLKILPKTAPVWQAVFLGWAFAFCEYALMVPANRLFSAQGLNVGQMKMTQEVVTLLVFVPFMLYLFKTPLKLDHLWAALCLLGAVFFVFRSA